MVTRSGETRPEAGRHRCSIVPPFILERLARSPDEHLAAAARQALRHDHHHRAGARGDEPPPPAPSGLARSTIDGGPQRLISDAHGGTTLPGDKVRGEGDPATGDVAATEAYDGLGATWELYAQAYGRNSLDGKGLPLCATVHYGEDYDNAFWDGAQMVFGDGDGKIFGRFTVSVDVIGHELTHGVTEHTAGLLYRDQSGALNESMSDVFGSLVKQRLLGQSADQADWLIGAGLLVGDLAGQALRSMRAPGTAYDNPALGKDPQPAHMRDYVETSDDNGGVHINSGIPNHAFYLLATALGGRAWEVAGAIWYAVLTGDGIAADCDFATFAQLTVAQAERRHGADSPEVQAVRSAWQQVGVLGSAPTGTDRSAPADDAADPGPAVVAVKRTGGFAGTTLEKTVDLTRLPAADERAWQEVLSDGRLQELQELAKLERMHPDTYCYGVSCESPPVDVSIGEQHLPDRLKDLFERTLREG